MAETSYTANYAPQSAGLLAPLLPWLSDAKVSEILINRPQEVFIEKGGSLCRYEVPALTDQHLKMLTQLIANENQQILGEKTPLLSGSLLDGSRVQIVVPPSAKHITLSIRRQVLRRLSLNDYQAMGFYEKTLPCLPIGNTSLPATQTPIENPTTTVPVSMANTIDLPEAQLKDLYLKKDWGAFIRLAIAQKKNLVISGGTSSGKTTFLNACLSEIPHHERIITLEDTREIELPHENQVNLLATKGEQGMAKVSMQDLVQACLRLRPDRIIMGEIRGREILDFISACSTGHEGSLTTIHANNPHIAFMRMTQMYKLNNVPSMRDQDILRELQTVIDVIIQLVKTPEGRQVKSVYYQPLSMTALVGV